MTYTIGLRRYKGAGTDAHGNAADGWEDPVSISVYAIAPRLSAESDPVRGVVIGLEVYAPPGTTVDSRDRAVLDGIDYEIDGEIADWTRSPFGSAGGGVVLNLKRVEG